MEEAEEIDSDLGMGNVIGSVAIVDLRDPSLGSSAVRIGGGCLGD